MRVTHGEVNKCMLSIYWRKDAKRVQHVSQQTRISRGCVDLIFIGPCIVIYSHSATRKMNLLFQIIYSCKTLYMFRTVFPSIIRSSKLRIQQRYMSNSCCYLLLSGMRWNAVPSHPRQQQVAAALWHIPLLHTQCWAPDDGRKDRPKHVQRFTRINKLRQGVHLVGCTVGIYYDARTYEY
jgi:hypothetical protein